MSGEHQVNVKSQSELDIALVDVKLVRYIFSYTETVHCTALAMYGTAIYLLCRK